MKIESVFYLEFCIKLLVHISFAKTYYETKEKI